MNDLPVNLFANPAWNALQTKHRHLAVSAGDACRYPADIAPFAAVAVACAAPLEQLQSLLVPGDPVWLVGNSYPNVAGLSLEATLETLQMVLPEKVIPSDPTVEIIRLSDANAPEMVALTNLAFPGFFRMRTMITTLPKCLPRSFRIERMLIAGEIRWLHCYSLTRIAGLFLTDDFQVVQSTLEVLSHHFVQVHEETHDFYEIGRSCRASSKSPTLKRRQIQV